MINSIIKLISVALNNEFGDAYENHMEEIKQDLKEPCFFISCLNPTTNLFLNRRYFRQNQFCIQYFPKSANKQQECNNVAEKMLWCLEWLTVTGDLVKGSKIKYEIVDGILNFFVNYDFFVYKVEKSTAMETLESKVNVKG